jgi:hypothetical protein
VPYAADADPRHAGAPWCEQVMRLHLAITGKTIWCGKTDVMRDGNGGHFRGNRPGPNGEVSLPQKAIAGWPHDHVVKLGVRLGKLGA